VHGIPCEVAIQVAGILTLRGWIGTAQRCQNCRRAA